MTPQLHVVVGLPGAGKTTRARQLAERWNAVRLGPDEWMTDLAVDLFDELWRQLSERNRRPGEAVIDRATLNGHLSHWQSPTADELAACDAVTPPR